MVPLCGCRSLEVSGQPAEGSIVSGPSFRVRNRGFAMDLGQAIADVRQQKCIKQKVLARECKISQTYLSQIENNRRDPTLSTLKKISQVLEVPLPIIFFLSLTDEDIPEQKKEAFAYVSSSMKAFVQEFFSDSLQNSSPT